MPSVSPQTPASTAPSKKKRSRKDSNDDASKSSRGRPRVEANDETAADRRRTQIRLAQRAYRMRKETTITSLQERVSVLQNAAEQMSSTFLSISDLALGSGLGQSHPQLAQDLQRAARQFALLTEQVNSSIDGASDSQDQNFQPKFDESSFGDGSHSDTSQHSPPTLIEPYTEDLGKPLQHIGFGVFTVDNDDQSDSAQDSTSLSTWAQSQAIPEDVAPSQELDADIGALIRTPSPSPGPFDTARMPSIFTYSFEETSFARRLHRACLERAFYILSKPGNKYVEESFKLLLPFKRADQIREFARSRLARGADEPLESSFYYPFSHLGGAGTHYPRASSHVFPSQMPGAKLAAWIKSQEVERNFAEKMVPLPVNTSGFEGVWFDPEDVEGYLAERGIYISPQAYFAEADMIEEPSWKPSIVPTIEGQRQSNLSNASDVLFGRGLGPVEHEDQFGRVIRDMSEEVSMYEGSNSLTPDISGAGEFSLPTPPSLSDGRSPSRKHVVIDVSKLVDGLVNRAICLGRTPGYRKRDVERALQKAITAF